MRLRQRANTLLPLPLWPITWIVGLTGFLVEYVAWTVGLGAALLTRFGTRGRPSYAASVPPPDVMMRRAPMSLRRAWSAARITYAETQGRNHKRGAIEIGSHVRHTSGHDNVLVGHLAQPRRRLFPDDVQD